MNPIVYQDGVRVIAAGATYATVRFGVTCNPQSTVPELVLTQDEARELAAALTWMISEVDAKHGRESFKPERELVE